MTYQECLNFFGTDYKIKKEIASERMIQLEPGMYSDTKFVSELEYIFKKYPRAVFCGQSAYYYHGLTDVIPDVHHLLTLRSDTRIKDERVKQYFVEDALYGLGKEQMLYNGNQILIYNRERMLLDLMRFEARIPRDYYKEIIGGYRRIADEMDFYLLEEYAQELRSCKKILDKISREVL